MEKLIRKYLMAFGFLPMLLVIEVLEQEERYDLCHIVFKQFKKYYKELNIEVPRRFSEEAIIELKLAFMVHFGLSGETAVGNTPYYASEILVAINKESPPTEKRSEKLELSDFNLALIKCLNVKPK